MATNIGAALPRTPCDWVQGRDDASLAFCVAIHPEVRALDAELAVHGGCARFIMDDGYACGP
eukprot:639466-Prymnesium_polylepis.1